MSESWLFTLGKWSSRAATVAGFATLFATGVGPAEAAGALSAGKLFFNTLDKREAITFSGIALDAADIGISLYTHGTLNRFQSGVKCLHTAYSAAKLSYDWYKLCYDPTKHDDFWEIADLVQRSLHCGKNIMSFSKDFSVAVNESPDGNAVEISVTRHNRQSYVPPDSYLVRTNDRSLLTNSKNINFNTNNQWNCPECGAFNLKIIYDPLVTQNEVLLEKK